MQLAGTLLHMCKRHGVLLDMCAEALHQIHGSSTGLWTNIATKTFIGSSCQMNHWTKATFWTRFNQDITKTTKPISCVSMMVELCHPCAHLSYTLWKMGGVGGGGWGYQCGSNLLGASWHWHCNPLKNQFSIKFLGTICMLTDSIRMAYNQPLQMKLVRIT